MRKKNKIKCFLLLIVVMFLSAILLVGVGAAQNKDNAEVINIYGVNWQTDWVQSKLDEWSKDHPDIKINYHGEAAYYDKILLLLMTQQEKVDIMLANPGYLKPWVKAGWLASLENMPGVEERKEKMNPGQVSAYSYKGNLYVAGAWYQLCNMLCYNERLLKEAGFNRPPKTWDELIEQSLIIKEKGIKKYPLALYYKPTSRRLNWVWYQISLSLSGNDVRPLWSEDLEPMFLDSKSPGYRALQYMKDFLQEYKIVSEGSFEVDTFDVVTEMMKGNAVFATVTDHQLNNLSDKERTKEAGNIKLMMFPNSGFTWYKGDGFGMSRAAANKSEKHKMATWEVLKYLTSPEFAKERLKKWFGQSIYPELYQDPEVQKIIKTIVPNPEVYYAQREKWVNLQHFVDPVYKTVFYFDYLNEYLLPNLQRAVQGNISIDEALKNINDGVQNLKNINKEN